MEWDIKNTGNAVGIVFNISQSEKGYTSTLDSPDQKATGIPVTTTSFENQVLKLAISNAGIEYEGTLDKTNTIVGTFKQGGQSIPLNLSSKIAEKEKIARPQEPVKPYPYYSEDITFENKTDNIVLAGTLTLPEQGGRNFPAVILITGSGPQNRDEEVPVLRHKSFLVLSDYLTKKGIAVLRFDDRGVGESTGDFAKASTIDFSRDVQAGVDYLKTRKEINKDKIGLIGHSEGGIIAPIVAGNSNEIDFIVLLAGPGLRGDKLILLQKEVLERQGGASEDDIQKGQDIFKGAYDIIIASSVNDENLKKSVGSYFNSKLDEASAKSITASITNNWFYTALKMDPAMALAKVKCPVLALNGSKDLQVPAEVNLEIIKNTLAKSGNKKVTAKILPNLNHLFQECKTGSTDEYGTIEQTFSPIALEEISNWVLLQTK